MRKAPTMMASIMATTLLLGLLLPATVFANVGKTPVLGKTPARLTRVTSRITPATGSKPAIATRCGGEQRLQ